MAPCRLSFLDEREAEGTIGQGRIPALSRGESPSLPYVREEEQGTLRPLHPEERSLNKHSGGGEGKGGRSQDRRSGWEDMRKECCREAAGAERSLGKVLTVTSAGPPSRRTSRHSQPGHQSSRSVRSTDATVLTQCQNLSTNSEFTGCVVFVGCSWPLSLVSFGCRLRQCRLSFKS